MKPRYEIWQTIKSFPDQRVSVLVVEINQGELVKRAAEGLRNDPLPWAITRYSQIVRRYWIVADGVHHRSWNFYAIFNTAQLIKARLEAGEQIKPTWERNFSDGTRPRKANKKN